MRPIALTIAGSDSGGGAGIQADLKTFQMNGVYGCSVITAITAQNTCGVQAIHMLEPALIEAQMNALFEDMPIAALKTGMLGTAENCRVIAQQLTNRTCQIVVDPVMVATSGDILLQPGAIAIMRAEILPRATLITPNIAEAQILTATPINDRPSMQQAAERLYRDSGSAILIKGGHLAGAPHDLFYDGREHQWLKYERIDTKHSHGTGCSYSAAITAYLSQGYSIWSAITQARQYIQQALIYAYPIGKGQSPIDHSWFIDQGATMGKH